MKHQKHPPIHRRHRGAFGPNEVALIGAPCEILNAWADRIQAANTDRRMAWIDANHHPEPMDSKLQRASDEQGHWHLTVPRSMNAWDQRAVHSDQDLVLVNGNHFSASAQIAFVHPKKSDSLLRKADRLTDLRAVVVLEGELPEWLEQLAQSNGAEIFRGGSDRFDGWFVSQFLSPAPVFGLVLAGGRSTRMGKDKGSLEIHGREQRLWMYEQLLPFCAEAFISCRPDQDAILEQHVPSLPDRLHDFGPYGALLTAFMHRSDVAWLVVACDMPGVTPESIAMLLEHRQPQRTATAFRKSANAFPEPLFAVWEPKSYHRLTAFLAQGNSCPRKVLINSDTHQVDVPDARWLENVNTPEDLSRWTQG